MVGQLVLDQPILVQAQAPEPFDLKRNVCYTKSTWQDSTFRKKTKMKKMKNGASTPEPARQTG